MEKLALALNLGEFLSAEANGRSLGRAPNASVAALAVCLAESGQEARSRPTLAAALYPAVDREAALTALRQSVRRLRQWLGEAIFDARRESIRFAAHVTICVREGDLVSAGYSHPVFDKFRNQSVTANIQEPLNAFAQLVRDVAAIDKDSARGLLAGAPSMTKGLLPDQSLSLLYLTNPKSRKDAYAFEHCEMISWVLFMMGRKREAEEWIARGSRIAHHAKRYSQVSRIKSLRLFFALECGDLGTARVLLAELESSKFGQKLIVNNAIAAFAWNTGLGDASLRLYKSRLGSIRGESRADRLHFWANASVLSAELNDHEFYDYAASEAMKIVIPEVDVEHYSLLRLAECRLAVLSEPDRACRMIHALRMELEHQGRSLLATYCLEAEALALAAQNQPRLALAAWRKAQNFRANSGFRNTPRLLAMGAKIRQLAGVA